MGSLRKKIKLENFITIGLYVSDVKGLIENLSWLDLFKVDVCDLEKNFSGKLLNIIRVRPVSVTTLLAQESTGVKRDYNIVV